MKKELFNLIISDRNLKNFQDETFSVQNIAVNEIGSEQWNILRFQKT